MRRTYGEVIRSGGLCKSTLRQRTGVTSTSQKVELASLDPQLRVFRVFAWKSSHFSDTGCGLAHSPTRQCTCSNRCGPLSADRREIRAQKLAEQDVKHEVSGHHSKMPLNLFRVKRLRRSISGQAKLPGPHDNWVPCLITEEVRKCGAQWRTKPHRGWVSVQGSWQFVASSLTSGS